MSRIYPKSNEHGSTCLIQSLQCFEHGLGDGSLLNVHGEEPPAKMPCFDGTDRTTGTEFRTEIINSLSGVVTCIRWNHNPEFCLAATSDGRVQLEHTGNNHNLRHLFHMETTSPDSTKYVSLRCLESNMYLQCDNNGTPYMFKDLDLQAWFQIIRIDDMVDSGSFVVITEQRGFSIQR